MNTESTGRSRKPLLNLENLRQLVAFADCGTLSAAAKKCHVSQPTLTRTMQMVEEDFGVPLFIRSKNKIELNETGLLAVQNARNVLSSAESTYNIVRAFDKAKRTIQIEACAPAPLWSLIPRLTGRFPEMSLTSEIVAKSDKIIEDILEDACSLGVVLYPVEENGIFCCKYMDEKLYICLPADHEIIALSHQTTSDAMSRRSPNVHASMPARLTETRKKAAVTFDDIDGYNCLLRSQLGFWSELVYRKMPSSKFLVQADDFAMEELTRSTELPYFVTDVSSAEKGLAKDRIILPIEDEEACVSYYLITKDKSLYNYLGTDKLLTSTAAITLSPLGLPIKPIA